jgi:3',5'-cyclic AMP phosphodiesterase CpdA
VNVVDLKAGGLGRLGPEQLAWLADDINDKSNSTPIVVFAHIPLWTVYADWVGAPTTGSRLSTC